METLIPNRAQSFSRPSKGNASSTWKNAKNSSAIASSLGGQFPECFATMVWQNPRRVSGGRIVISESNG